MMAQPSSASTILPNFVLFTNLPGVHSILFSRPLVNMPAFLISYWPRYFPLGYTTRDWSPARLCGADHNSLSPEFQPVSVHLTIQLPIPCFLKLSMRLLGKAMSSLARQHQLLFPHPPGRGCGITQKNLLPL